MKRREFLRASLFSAAAGALSRNALGQHAAIDETAAGVRRVLVVFKCHLDVGFTDTQANVMGRYFSQYYPAAMATAARLREAGKNRYIWTTGSWLLYEYLEQANTEERHRMEQAIEAGDIAWHALPFSWQTELLDRSMIRGCLGFSSTLDERFGRKTIAGKMTDVPGHSRGLVSVLAENGIQLLDIGVNAASTPPDVPDVFKWTAPDGSSIAVLYHKYGYGSVVRVPGSDLAIAVEVRGDNSGPHTEDEINGIYTRLQQQYPGAQINAATLSDVAAGVKAAIPGLPVFTQEIGDTWIYGAPSDPPKIARYREMARVRQEWLAGGKLKVGDADDRQLLRRLALAVEHTWGTDTKRYIDHDHYSPKELAAYVDTPNYQIMEHSWQEKRDDIDAGVANLPAPLRTEAEKRLQGLHMDPPKSLGMHPHDARTMIHTTHFELMLDARTGSIETLTKRDSHHSWASASHPLALFSYQTLSQSDYTAFLAAYVRSKASWAPQDFGKPNLDRFPAKSKTWQPVLRKLWTSENSKSHRVLAELAIEDKTSEQVGLVAWPGKMYLDLVFPKTEPAVQIAFHSLGKAQNRMPEAMWLTFAPDVSDGATWSLDKVDQEVSVTDVVRGGGRRMHAVTSKVRCQDGNQRFELTTLDAPVVALGSRSPLNFSEDLPDLHQGVHINLFNNAWGTNYPQWAGGDWTYRFRLSI